MNISLFHNIYRVIIFICRTADEKQTYKNSFFLMLSQIENVGSPTRHTLGL